MRSLIYNFILNITGIGASLLSWNCLIFFTHLGPHCLLKPIKHQAIMIAGYIFWQWTYSLNRLLWMRIMTPDLATLLSPPTPAPSPTPVPPPRLPDPAMGLFTPEESGLPERGLILIGDVWLMGLMSALAGVPVPRSRLDAFELTPERTITFITSDTQSWKPLWSDNTEHPD